MTPEELKDRFKEETELDWLNSQGEPEIDYVAWLEQKITDIPSDDQIVQLAIDEGLFSRFNDVPANPIQIFRFFKRIFNK